MSSDDQDFLDAIARFGQEFLSQHPRLADHIETARAGAMDPKEVIKEVWKAAAQNKGFQSDVEKALFNAFKIEPGSTDLAHFPERQKMLDRWGFTEEDLIFQPFEDRPNYKMLHPMLMGMIVELLQFDGDIPELRTGELPPGGTPAVPVKTTARNPVVIGAMLRRASEEVQFELGAAQEEGQSKLERMIAMLPEDGEGVTGLVRQESERGIAVPGYEPGKPAAIREVEPPTAMELARMPFEQKQELAHKALTSRQGRKSAVPVIADMILDSLRNEGYSALRMGNSKDLETSDVFAEVEWGLQIDGGKGERNPNFNFIDTAARSLTAKLNRELRGNASRYTQYWLAVSPINTISERRVGWRAALYGS
jgi:hypothetical protein